MTNSRTPRAAFARAALLLVLGACAQDGPPDDAVTSAVPPAWPVADQPALSIGVVDGEPQYQLHQVVGAVRLNDGRIAVMNAGSGQLRIYAPDGTFISSAGGVGEGPGEFGRASRMHLIADTIIIYDARLQRLSLHDASGRFLDNRPLRTRRKFQLDEWLYNRSWIDGPPLGVGRAPVMSAIRQLPLPDTVEAFRHVRVSPYGQLWVREPTGPQAQSIGWLIYDMSGSPIGRVQLPARFEVLDFGPDYLLGRSRDDLDVEYVQLLHIEPAAPQQRFAFTASPADTVTEMATDPALVERQRVMMGALRMLNNAQEIFYSTPANAYEYATHVSKIADYEVPEGIAIRIVKANERGWSAAAVDRATGAMCGVGIGLAAPPGWTPGVVVCQ